MTNMNTTEEGTPVVTDASSWRKQTTEGTPLRVPSGNVCLVRPGRGLDMFLSQGKIPNALMSIVEDAMSRGGPPKLDGIQATPEMLGAIQETVDAATIYLVMQPEVRPVPMTDTGHPVPIAVRDPGDFLYVDEVVFEDKMFIFNWAVGGPADIEQFRAGLESAMESVPGREDVE